MSNDIPEWACVEAYDRAYPNYSTRSVEEKLEVVRHLKGLKLAASLIAQHEQERVDPFVKAVMDACDAARWGYQGESDVKELVAELRKHGMELAKPADDGWIEWGGGGCPVPADTMVEVRHRSGRQDTDRADFWDACWQNDNDPDDIIAYRVVKP